jgi:hypothetical protein
MNIEERKIVHQKMMDEVSKTFFNLYFRWESEREYEDIKEYGEVLKPLVKKVGADYVKMSKRPFGVIYSLGNKQQYIMKALAKGNKVKVVITSH